MISGVPWPLHRTAEGWNPAGQVHPRVVLPLIVADQGHEQPAREAVVLVEAQHDADGPASLASQLLKLAGFLLELRDQAHLAHLNIEGPLFLPVHAFLGEQYEAIAGQFDVICEHVRAMGFRMPPSSPQLRGLCDCFCHCSATSAREILSTYGANLDCAAEMATAAEELAAEARQIDIQNSLAELVAHCRKGSWMLAATLAPQ